MRQHCEASISKGPVVANSGRNRSDFDFGALLRGKRAGILVDAGSEVPGAPEQVEDDPPELTAEAPLVATVALPEPIPVSIVPGSDYRYTRTDFHTNSATVQNTTPKQLCGANEYKTRVFLRNTSDSLTVYFGNSPDGAKMDGYPLEPNAEIELFVQSEVWGILKTATGTDMAVVSVLMEYAWPVR
jgi:hypothetical protein